AAQEPKKPAADKPAAAEMPGETKPAAEATKPAAPEEKPDSAAPAEKSELEKMLHSGALGYMIDGGIFMWPIFFLGVLAISVIIERYRSLRMLGTDTAELRAKVVD